MPPPRRSGPDPARLTRAETKARTRALLLDAAADVFAEQGFAGASVEEIARRAGFTIGALYAHFPGKDDLFLTLFEEHVSHHLENAARIAGGDDVLATFGAYLTEVADEHAAWSMLELEFLRYALPRPELLARLAERWRVPRDTIAELAGGGLFGANGDPRAVATVIMALFEGLVLQRRIDRAAVPAALFSDALRWLARGLVSEKAGETRPG
ncbi:TetR family transcriptional regulator [Acrocarpospora phusangensis]|uniref:TetR family transcriptional regulator n=1 Tax=Acrocarpospora phusangensis TaxID=1070424 RepID=A0A919Q7P5_9ACTN|nr:TetR/AcrR family transcriptional regulator [Acrocarpospora phusangensis]GIH23726.1 TetR family transcriptional regulator [Acrocarpospora phusangensis]